MTTYIEQLQSIFQMIVTQSTFLTPYLPAIQTAGIILALVICLAGYQVRKLCAALIGLLVGAAASAIAAFHFTNDLTITIGAAVLGGGIIAFVAYCIYRLGIFLLCASLTLFFLRNIWIGQPPAITAMCAVMAVVIGFIAAFFKRIGITLITSIGGAFAAVKLFSMLKGYPTGMMFTICFAVLAVIGFILQYQPWKDRKQRDQEDKQQLQKEKAKRKSSSGNGKKSFFSKKPKRSKKGKNKTKTKIVYRDTTSNYPNQTNEDTYDNTEYDNQADYIEDYDEETAYTKESDYEQTSPSYSNTAVSNKQADDSDFNYAKKTVYTHPMDTMYHTKVNLNPNRPDTSTKNLAQEPAEKSTPVTAPLPSKTEPSARNQTKRKPIQTRSESSDEYDFFSVINECINSNDE